MFVIKIIVLFPYNIWTDVILSSLFCLKISVQDWLFCKNVSVRVKTIHWTRRKNLRVVLLMLYISERSTSLITALSRHKVVQLKNKDYEKGVHDVNIRYIITIYTRRANFEIWMSSCSSWISSSVGDFYCYQVYSRHVKLIHLDQHNRLHRALEIFNCRIIICIIRQSFENLRALPHLSLQLP